MTAEDEQEFQEAMDQYKRRSGRLFPTCSEILEVIRSLGYEKRIWRPVGPWGSVAAGAIEGFAESESRGGLLGWYARAETPTIP